MQAKANAKKTTDVFISSLRATKMLVNLAEVLVWIISMLLKITIQEKVRVKEIIKQTLFLLSSKDNGKSIQKYLDYLKGNLKYKSL